MQQKNKKICKIWLAALLIVSCLPEITKAECNVCARSSNQACVSRTEFQLCNEDGQPDGPITKCGGDSVCDLEGQCNINTDLVACNNCNKCDSTKTFACTGTQTFALCLGEDDPEDITGICNDGFVCDVNNHFICGELEAGSWATCSKEDDPTTLAPTTTPSPTTQPNSFCEVLQEEGRFPIGTDPDTTCRQYISCKELRNGDWIGSIYRCPGETYFDSTRKICNGNLPSRCNINVRALFVFNLGLNFELQY